MVNKVVKDRARGIMIVPTWIEKAWFDALGAVAVDWVDIPQDTPLYQNNKGGVFPNQRGWTTRAVLFDASHMVISIDEKVENFFCQEEQQFHFFEEENWVQFHTRKQPGNRTGTYNVIATGD